MHINYILNEWKNKNKIVQGHVVVIMGYGLVCIQWDRSVVSWCLKVLLTLLYYYKHIFLCNDEV